MINNHKDFRIACFSQTQYLEYERNAYDWPEQYFLNVNSSIPIDIINWCFVHFGMLTIHWNFFMVYDDQFNGRSGFHFEFKNSADATLFILTWGN